MNKQKVSEPIDGGLTRDERDQSYHFADHLDELGWFPLSGRYGEFKLFFESRRIRGTIGEAAQAKLIVAELQEGDDGLLLMVDHEVFTLRVHLMNSTGTDTEDAPALTMWASGDLVRMLRWLPVTSEFKHELCLTLPVDEEERSLLRLAI